MGLLALLQGCEVGGGSGDLLRRVGNQLLQNARSDQQKAARQNRYKRNKLERSLISIIASPWRFPFRPNPARRALFSSISIRNAVLYYPAPDVGLCSLH